MLKPPAQGYSPTLPILPAVTDVTAPCDRGLDLNGLPEFFALYPLAIQSPQSCGCGEDMYPQDRDNIKQQVLKVRK